MVGPVPGISAQRLPSSVPRIIGQNDFFRSAFDGNMSEMPTLAYFMSTVSVLLMLFMNSAMPNMPSASAMISTPSNNSVMPKVNRGWPVSMSEPTMPTSRPSTVIAMPLSGEPLASVEPASRPTSISEQTSAGPNSSAILTRNGARKIISVMPNDAPMKAAIGEAQRRAALALLGQRKAVETGHRVRWMTWQIKQDRTDRAAVLRAVIDT